MDYKKIFTFKTMDELISKEYVMKLTEALDYVMYGNTATLSKENLAQLIVNGLLDDSYAIYLKNQ